MSGNSRTSRIAMVDIATLEDQSPMSTNALARVMAQAPTMRPGFSASIKAIMTDISIAPLEKEIAILGVIHLDKGEYECAQHQAVAAAMGIPSEKVDAIAEERFDDPIFTEREKALLAFVHQTVKLVRVDDPTFERMKQHYDDRQIVELIYLIGTYMTIVRISEVARVPLDGINGPTNWGVGNKN